MNALISRQNTFFVVISFLILTFFSCSDDPSSPVEPKPKDTVTIGVDGGIIEKDDLSITIPAGAFDGDYDLSVSEVEDDAAFGENSISSSYQISGLPENFNKPIDFKIMYNGDLSDESYIALGSERFDDLKNNSSFIYDLLPASDSAGALSSSFSPGGEQNLSKNNSRGNSNIDSFEKIIKGITGNVSHGSKYFWVVYPVTLESKVTEVEEIFDSAAELIWNDLGINFNLKQTSLRLTRRIVLKTQDNIAVTYDFNSENARSLYNVSRNHVSKSLFSDIKFKAGISLLDVELQTLYNEANIEPNVWLNRAIVTWSEELFSDLENYKPSYAFNNKVWMAPFNGFQSGANQGTQGFGETFWQLEHGIGMAPLIKYLVEDERSGQNVIKRLSQDIWENKKSNDALLRVINAPVEDWWPDFIKKHINSEIYDRPIEYFLSNTTNVWEINNDQDLEKVFNSSDPNIGFYPDLSAKLFKVKLNYSEFGNSQKLLLNMNSLNNNKGLSLIVFSIDKYNKAEYLGTSKEVGVELADLKGYYDKGTKQFLIALVNSNITSENYLGQSDIDLEIKVEKETQNVLDFNTCSFGLSFRGKIKVTTPNGTRVDDKGLDWGWYIYKASGSFSGNTFTGGFNERSGEFIGAITVTLNDEHTLITNFEYTFENRPDETTVSNYFVSGNDLPSKLLDPLDYRFGIPLDSKVCNHLSKVEYKYTDASSTPVTKELINHSCDEYSGISISFNKE